jgi:hypothetical protein
VKDHRELLGDGPDEGGEGHADVSISSSCVMPIRDHHTAKRRCKFKSGKDRLQKQHFRSQISSRTPK